MQKYAKAVVEVVITVLAALAVVWAGGVSAEEWVNVAIIGAGALGVFAAPNVPGAEYTKAILAATTAGLVVLASVITSGVGFPELVQIIIAAAGAVGVYAIPNKGVPTVGARAGVVR